MAGGERIGRYSFIGTEPYDVFSTGADQPSGQVDPLTLVQREMDSYQLVPVEGLPPFHGGGVGYVAYDAVHYFEPRVPMLESDPQGLPESVFMFTDTLLVFDHLRHDIKVVSHARLDDGDVDAAYAAAIAKIERMVDRLSRPLEIPPELLATPSLPVSGDTQSNFTVPEYEAVIEKCIEYIYAGDVIQVVNSQRFSRRTDAHPFQVYRALRSGNPSPYMYYLDLNGFQIVGAAIETVATVHDGPSGVKTVATHPIAGTRPRGQTPAEDIALEEELKGSEKQQAEHIMLLDLGRNDIGRVSVPGTVHVTQFMDVERFSHVMHLVSHVEGPTAARYDHLRRPARLLPRRHRLRRAQDPRHGDHRRGGAGTPRPLRRRGGLLQLQRQHGHRPRPAHRHLQGRRNVRPGRRRRGSRQRRRRRIHGNPPQVRRHDARHRHRRRHRLIAFALA